MDDLAKLKAIGEDLGYEGLELRTFIKEQQSILRDERAADRACQREKEEASNRAAREEAERQMIRDAAERQEKKEAADRLAQKEARESAERQAERVRSHQLQMAERGAIKIEANVDNAETPAKMPHAPPIPIFRDGRDDMDSYLTMFERQAKLHGWDEAKWATYLASHLQGKALDVYSRMAADEAEDYDKLKTALLLRYDVTAEAYRKKFRNNRPEKFETFAQYHVRQQTYITRWIEMTNTEKTYEGLLDLLHREHFLDISNRDLRVFITERRPSNMKEVVMFAEQFREARDVDAVSLTRASAANPSRYSHSLNTSKLTDVQRSHEVQRQVDTPRNFQRTDDTRRPQQSHEFRPREFKPMRDLRSCFLCHKTGHIALNCPTRVNKTALMAEVRDFMHPQDGGQSQGHSDQRDIYPTNKLGRQKASACQSVPPQDRRPIPECNGPHSLRSDYLNQGQSNSIGCYARDGLLTEVRACDEFKLTNVCQVNNEVHMPISSGFVQDTLVTVLRDSGCNCIIVRESKVDSSCLTGDTRAVTLADGTVIKALVANITIDTPYLVGIVDAICLKTPVYDLIIGNVLNARPPHLPDPTWHRKEVATVQTRQQTQAADKPYPNMKVPGVCQTDVSPSEIVKAQTEDPTLSKIRVLAENDSTISVKTGFVRWYRKNDLIYREFTSAITNEITDQLVVPKVYRNTVLRLAHESLMAGHQATKRTTDRVLSSFHWPGVMGDIKRYCQSCDICQRTTVKGRVGKVPLGKMPLVDVPFRKVGVDIVGPLVPMTDNKNRYILTLIDFSTRYPEAVALPSIETTRVAEALVDIFSRIGVPEEMLTDRGSNFTSAMMDEVSRLLSVKRIFTTPYHPQSNGLVERFNGTLKTMIKRMCSERPRDWDRFLSAALFAYREIPNESTGFAPFELVYGRTVRGPMAILRDIWTQEINDSEVKTVYQYVLDLRERLEETCKIAQENVARSAKKHKRIFDLKAKDRQMKVGDEALILLPTDHNKLLLQWRGPYTVIDKLGQYDYKLNVHGKHKVFHANLLKVYNRREQVSVAIVEEEDGDDLQLIDLTRQGPDNVEVNPELSSEQKTKLQQVLQCFDDVLTDVPGRTELMKHDIQLATAEPIRFSYPLAYNVEQAVNEEVAKMLKMGIIEESCSPYSSPVVIVRKKDGSNRFCIDYRRVNEQTIFDAEPIPNIEDIFKNMAGNEFFSRLDLTSGYWQLPLTQSAKKITAFRTPKGLYQFTVMPFGLVTAPASFTRLMRKLLDGLENVDNYIDDVMIFTHTFDEHIKVLTEVLQRLRQAHLTVKPNKCCVGYRTVECLGHHIGKDYITTHPEKVKAIQNAPRPETKTQIRSFLGMTGFYRKFIPNYANIALPLTDLTKNKMPNKIKWTDECYNSFQALKETLIQTPILKLPDTSEPFILQTDASDKGLGAVLMQEMDGQKKAVAYASKKLNRAELSYSTIEKECLAIVWSVKKFSRYLYGREFTLETDHRPLTYLRSAKTNNSRLMRWALSLQPYRFRITAIKGVDNVSADYLSRSGSET